MNTQKNQLRKAIKAKRLRLSIDEQNRYATQLTERLLQTPEFIQSQHIAGYWPVQGEISPLPALTIAYQQGKHIYLPVIHPNHSLSFCALDAFCSLDSKSIWDTEPYPLFQEPIQLDLALVPVVAFTEQGKRLGTGKGYYDRTFAYKQQAPTNPPILLGIAYDFQKVSQVWSESWDVSLQGVITENHFFKFD